MSAPTVLVMAGGTGGHIFPGLAIAEVLQRRGWNVHWMGAPSPSMESKLVPTKGFVFEAVKFGGLRGKGISTMLLLPWRLLQAFIQSWRVIRRLRPDVLLGLGGYISFPGGLMGVLCGKPLLVHEQNSVAGMANTYLAKIARRVFTSFPCALPNADWVGNPLRETFITQEAPTERFAHRQGPLRVVVMGGSLGAQALNTVVPQAIALLPINKRPIIVHQGGEKNTESLKTAYTLAGVEAELVGFISEPAELMAKADLVICRAGASTISEIAAIGVASVLVPFPYAVDDHQTLNAKFLSEQGGAWLMPQSTLTPELLAQQLQDLTREELLNAACNAYSLRQTQAAEKIADACQKVMS